MVSFPNCKINLGLNITEKREDGFHNIESVFFPIFLNDALEIISTSEKETKFYNTGIPGGPIQDNLCLKAFHLIKKDFPQLPEIKMHLHKGIPVGAGMGGGSADATFTLLLLNKKYNLNISEKKLFEYTLQLGSDCPFFLLNQTCFACGRGEILDPINLSLSGYKILLINPGIQISTKKLFKEITPKVPSKKISKIVCQPLITWKSELVNDFENIVFKEHKLLKEIKESLYYYGAEYSAMTGTGSTIFGIFHSDSNFIYPDSNGYFQKWINFN